MMLQKSRADRKADCEKPPVRVFAWLPKDLDDGRIVWLEWVWKKTYWTEVGLPGMPFNRVRYTKEKP